MGQGVKGRTDQPHVTPGGHSGPVDIDHPGPSKAEVDAANKKHKAEEADAKHKRSGL